MSTSIDDHVAGGSGQVTADELTLRIDGHIRSDGPRLAALLADITGYATRGAFRDDGMPDMVTWLTARLSLAPTTARAYVRVGVALSALPLITKASTAGLLSFDQVALITRVATPDDEGDWLSQAESLSYAQLQASVRKASDVNKESEEAVRRRDLRFGSSEDGTETRLWGRGPTSDAAAIHQALMARIRDMPADYINTHGLGALMWDALYESVVGPNHQPTPDTDGEGAGEPRWAPAPTTNIHIDADIYAGLVDGAALIEGYGTLSLSACFAEGCDSPVRLIIKAAGKVIGTTAAAYPFPARLRRLLWDRDQGCRFCGRQHWLHAHHIVAHPSGTTSLANGVLVCRWHHRLIHTLGWTIRGDPNDTLELLNPQGTVKQRA